MTLFQLILSVLWSRLKLKVFGSSWSANEIAAWNRNLKIWRLLSNNFTSQNIFSLLKYWIKIVYKPNRLVTETFLHQLTLFVCFTCSKILCYAFCVLNLKFRIMFYIILLIVKHRSRMIGKHSCLYLIPVLLLLSFMSI